MRIAHNDLSLLERLPTTSVIFGASRSPAASVESVDEIRERLVQALEHIDAERLLAAPTAASVCSAATSPWPSSKTCAKPRPDSPGMEFARIRDLSPMCR